MASIVMSMRGIVKRFGDLVAIRRRVAAISRPGEVHALVGENGAGKSTLMNILYGLLPRTAGEIVLRGEPVDFSGPGRGDRGRHRHGAPAFQAGALLHGRREHHPRRRADGCRSARLDRRAAERETAELSQRFGLDLDPRAIVGSLPVGLRQRVEILKALYRHAEVLILDEPTAVLTPQETRELFATMRLAGCRAAAPSSSSPTSCREVLAAVRPHLGDAAGPHRRDAGQPGRHGRRRSPARWSAARVLLRVAKTTAQSDRPRPALAVEDLTRRGRPGRAGGATGLSLAIRPGEIVGLAGVQGNGQDELVESIAGPAPPRGTAGSRSAAAVAAPGDPAAARRAGLAYVPADRARVGLSLQSAIWENMAVGHLPAVSPGAVPVRGRAAAAAMRAS